MLILKLLSYEQAAWSSLTKFHPHPNPHNLYTREDEATEQDSNTDFN